MRFPLTVIPLTRSASLARFKFSSQGRKGNAFFFNEYPVAVAKEESVEAPPDLIPGDGTTSDPGPGLTTLRFIQSNWKTAIESALEMGSFRDSTAIELGC